MTEHDRNIRIVKDMFAAFGRGELWDVMNHLSDDLYWQSPVTNTETEEISWAKPRHNRAEVADFFRELFEKVKPIEMKPFTFIAQDDHVVVEGATRGIVNATRQEYFHNWVMVITLKGGKVTRMRHYYDTVDVSKAFQAAEIRKAA